MGKNIFRILSIDGGGVRGVFPAHILKCIEERLNVDVYKNFDMFAGTSTGSIIAAGIAVNKKPSEIVSLYRNNGKNIFREPKRSCWPAPLKKIFHSTYENTELQKLLTSEFKNIKLGDVVKPLLIPSSDIGLGEVHVFKSAYSTRFTRDVDVKIRDAILASCSAPLYFDPIKVGTYLLADGGVWANNPSLAAVIDAIHRLDVEMSDIRVLSIGTGHFRSYYGTKMIKEWGFLTGWKHKQFIELILSLQAQSTQNYLKLMLKPNQLLRINFESDLPMGLDDPTVMDDLLSRADQIFSKNSSKLNSFFK